MSKMLKYTFGFLFLFGTLVTNAQKKMDQGTMVFEITDASADDAQMNTQVQMAKGSTTTIHFSEEQQRMDMNMMGGMVQMKTITKVDQSSMILMDMMGQKIKIDMTKEEAQASAPEMEYNVVADEKDTKDILGFKCVKHTITQKGAMEMEMIAYVAKDIKTSKSVIDQAKGLKLEGTPLEYTIHTNGIHITTVATKIDDKLENDVFTPSTEGYKEMTMQEFQAMSGGAGF